MRLIKPGTRHTPEYIVRLTLGIIFSIALRPPNFFHSGGGNEPGGADSGSRAIEEKDWSNLIIMNDISLYANYIVRQILVKGSVATDEKPYLLA